MNNQFSPPHRHSGDYCEDPSDAQGEGPFGAVALADFEAEFEPELSFKQGDKIIILSTVSSDGWWRAQIPSAEASAEGIYRRGLVPETYVEREELQPGIVRADFVSEQDISLRSSGKSKCIGAANNLPAHAAAQWLVLKREKRVTTVGGDRMRCTAPAEPSTFTHSLA